MGTLHEVRHVSISIDRPPGEVYAFASNPENLPRWATGLAGTIAHVNGEWIADAPAGKVKVRFAPRNDLGVLDHDVVLASGERVHVSMRVVENGDGSEVVFTLLRQEGTSDERLAEDARWVERDLNALKRLLEQ
ncbi:MULTISPECIES: SRPBCC family protein [unclassified Anaeromyxobacter]|uniref:SRPBCC family protein n=1 Tax=unclassified Anaeromyxobacter TaxID=2620896 RepID=UPI001F59D895|nr:MULTISPECIES: SRPBCC family protein [unclassified Anaeromyxobacter]